MSSESPMGHHKKITSEFIRMLSFYPSRRLGMESRASVYGIALAYGITKGVFAA